MSFWGVEVKPSRPYTLTVNESPGRLRLCQATLGMGNSESKSVLQCNVGQKTPVLLCSLLPDKFETSSLGIEFEETENVTFSVIGLRSIHLSGCYLGPTAARRPVFDAGSDTETFGEDIAESDTEKSVGDNDDYDYEDSFINDGKPSIFAVSSSSEDEAMSSSDEEVSKRKTRRASARKKSSRRRLKKTYVSSESVVSDDNKAQDNSAVSDDNKAQDRAAVSDDNEAQDNAAVSDDNKAQDKAAVNEKLDLDSEDDDRKPISSLFRSAVTDPEDSIRTVKVEEVAKQGNENDAAAEQSVAIEVQKTGIENKEDTVELKNKRKSQKSELPVADPIINLKQSDGTEPKDDVPVKVEEPEKLSEENDAGAEQSVEIEVPETESENKEGTVELKKKRKSQKSRLPVADPIINVKQSDGTELKKKESGVDVIPVADCVSGAKQTEELKVKKKKKKNKEEAAADSVIGATLSERTQKKSKENQSPAADTTIDEKQSIETLKKENESGEDAVAVADFVGDVGQTEVPKAKKKKRKNKEIVPADCVIDAILSEEGNVKTKKRKTSEDNEFVVSSTADDNHCEVKTEKKKKKRRNQEANGTAENVET